MQNDFSYEMRADQKFYFYMFHYDITKETPKKDDTPHYHRSMEFVYVVEGRFPVHIQGESRILHAGEVACVRSGQGHYYTTDGKAKVFVLIVSTDFLDTPFLEKRCMLPCFMMLSITKRNVLSRMLYNLMEIWSPGNHILNQGIFNTFYGLLAEDFLMLKTDDGRTNFPIVSILKYIDENYMEPISLKSLAARYNYTEPYFSSCFNALLKIPIREYINRIRIQQVNVYIETGLTKSQAAVLCGYTNNNTFYRAYKKYHEEAIKEIKIP